MNFKHIHIYLVLSGIIYWEIILNINDKHMQDYCCPQATFALCSQGGKLRWQGRLLGVVQWVTPTSRSCPGAKRESHVNSYRHQTMHRGKVDPRVSELP